MLLDSHYKIGKKETNYAKEKNRTYIYLCRVRSITTSKRIELESPVWSDFEVNLNFFKT